jgi:hypothetical protein
MPMAERQLRGPSMLALVGDLNGPALAPFADSADRRLRDSNFSCDPTRTEPGGEHDHHARFDLDARSRAAAAPDPVIGHIRRMGPHVEMVGSAAGRVVTAVADLEARQDPSIGQLKRDPMRVCPARPIPRPAMPLSVPNRPRPRPATISAGAINASPEACRQIGAGAARIPAGQRTVALGTVSVLPSVGGPEKSESAQFADQCDTLRGHQAHSWCQAPGVISTPGPLAAWILP